MHLLVIDRFLLVMPSDDVDGLGPGAHGTEGTTRHRKNANKHSNCDHSDAPAAYTDEQFEAVKRYMLSIVCNCTVNQKTSPSSSEN